MNKSTPTTWGKPTRQGIYNVQDDDKTVFKAFLYRAGSDWIARTRLTDEVVSGTGIAMPSYILGDRPVMGPLKK